VERVFFSSPNPKRADSERSCHQHVEPGVVGQNAIACEGV
jgi:hypothetical protein